MHFLEKNHVFCVLFAIFFVSLHPKLIEDDTHPTNRTRMYRFGASKSDGDSEYDAG